jgi:hypothetical protein
MPRLKKIKTLTFERWTQIYCADEFFKEGIVIDQPTIAEGLLLAEEVVRLRTLLRRHGHNVPVAEIDGEFPQAQNHIPT